MYEDSQFGIWIWNTHEDVTDTRLWTTVSGFESLPPSQFLNSCRFL